VHWSLARLVEEDPLLAQLPTAAVQGRAATGPRADGRLLYELRHRWRDGTTHVVFEALELIDRLAALVPPPRFHTVRYHGVLASRSKYRADVVPNETESAPGPSCTGGTCVPQNDRALRSSTSHPQPVERSESGRRPKSSTAFPSTPTKFPGTANLTGLDAGRAFSGTWSLRQLRKPPHGLTARARTGPDLHPCAHERTGRPKSRCAAMFSELGWGLLLPGWGVG
jgi:hypothetical protein